LRVWGLMSRLGTPLACPDVPRGETPKRIPSPMILGIEALIPHQRANTRDPSINKMIYYRIERGGVIELAALALQLQEFQYDGPDPEGIKSKIPSEDTARELTRILLMRNKEIIRSLEREI
jgi:hypothetical protein